MLKMSILEKEVFVTLSNKTIKHYQNAGYDIPKKKDKWGKLTVSYGTKIMVNIKDLTKGSNIKLTKICDDCGEIVTDQLYQSILKCRKNGDGKDRCEKCGKIYSGFKRKKNIKYENSLEFYAIKNNKEYLLKEFSSKNEKKPFEIFKSSRDIYFWICQECGSEYDLAVCRRTTSEENCPYCRGLRVNNTNSFGNTYPKQSDEWNYERNGDLTPFDITSRSSKKVWWICSENHEWKSRIADRKYNGCPFCNQSKGEDKIAKWLINNNIRFITQKEFIDLVGLGGGNLSYDFYLPKLNLLIEYQGEFHDGNGRDFTKINLKKQQEHDRRKRDYAKSHNINLLEIWYWDFDNVENILLNKLGGIK
jgi:hypothetical protein